MPHAMTIVVSAKREGDYETEDRMMAEIQEFAVSFHSRWKNQAHTLVKPEFGVDAIEMLDAVKSARDRSETTKAEQEQVNITNFGAVIGDAPDDNPENIPPLGSGRRPVRDPSPFH